MNPKAHRSLYDPRDGELPDPPEPSAVLLVALWVTLFALIGAGIAIGLMRAG